LLEFAFFKIGLWVNINTAQFFLEISNVNDDFKGFKASMLSFLYLFITFCNWANAILYQKVIP